ncbi:MAG: hypothetical protein J7M11_05915, partial [Elusimicrobia bacterium]|nr:hypothetical protein [Elusimicrobiota bacterium]
SYPYNTIITFFETLVKLRPAKLQFQLCFLNRQYTLKYATREYVLKGGEEMKFKVIIREDLEDGDFSFLFSFLFQCAGKLL